MIYAFTQIYPKSQGDYFNCPSRSIVVFFLFREKHMSELGDIMEEYCPQCGQYIGGESVCPYCGTEIFNESGLEEVEDELPDDF